MRALSITEAAPGEKHEMIQDRFFRIILVVGACFNFFMAAVILFPDSMGSFAELPRYESHFYPWLLALFVGLFGGVYAYLSRSPVIYRPLIVLAVVGKIGVFFVALACLLLGDLSPRAFVPAIGDLLFALVFLWWLKGIAFK